MSQQVVNIGSTAGDNTGDPLRTAFDKLNDNDAELYAAIDAAPFAATLAITEEDYSNPTVAIYWGGVWSDDGRWQVTKTVAGTQTRATIANNSGVANLAAAWAARASLTYA